MYAEFVDQATEAFNYEATMDRTMGDAHRSWHIVNGWDNGCPLDCADAYAPEPIEVGEIVTRDGRTFPIYDGDDVAAEARRIAAMVGQTVRVVR